MNLNADKKQISLNSEKHVRGLILSLKKELLHPKKWEIYNYSCVK